MIDESDTEVKTDNTNGGLTDEQVRQVAHELAVERGRSGGLKATNQAKASRASWSRKTRLKRKRNRLQKKKSLAVARAV